MYTPFCMTTSLNVSSFFLDLLIVTSLRKIMIYCHPFFIKCLSTSVALHANVLQKLKEYIYVIFNELATIISKWWLYCNFFSFLYISSHSLSSCQQTRLNKTVVKHHESIITVVTVSIPPMKSVFYFRNIPSIKVISDEAHVSTDFQCEPITFSYQSKTFETVLAIICD